MTSRFRERDLRVQECGTDQNWFLGTPPTTVCKLDGLWELCDDVIGNFGGVNPFLKRDRITHFPTLDGILYHTNGNKLREFVNLPIGYRPGTTDPTQHWGVLTTSQHQQYAWEILAGTNPSKPHISVPAALGELKDLPDLVRGNGRRLIEQVASGHLSWAFAVRPMANDLRKLVNFARAADFRLRMLYKLRDGKTLRKRVDLGTEEHRPADVLDFLLNTGVATIRGTIKTLYLKRVWGTAQWSLRSDSKLPELGYGPLKQLAGQLAAGFTSFESLAVAWELCPWSWLIDWFSNVSDVISASNNSLECTWSKVSLMRRMFCIQNIFITQPPPSWVTVSGDYVLWCERKERFPCTPVVPVPLPYLPILDGGQWSILASLAALRALSR